MREIKCPNCGQVFQVDETGYAQIVQQVRDQEFETELKRRQRELEEKKESEETVYPGYYRPSPEIEALYKEAEEKAEQEEPITKRFPKKIRSLRKRIG